MIIHEKLEQQSDAWFKVRQGRPTASEFNRIITAKTGALSASRVDYIDELIAERFIPEKDCCEVSPAYTGKKFIGNVFTDHGNEYEPQAREAFIKKTGMDVAEVGFVTREDGIVGCSPDGLSVDADGVYIAGLEIKCKCLKNHLAVLRTDAMPDSHKQQVHGSMAVTGLKEWYFVSWFPGFPAFIKKITADLYTEKVSTALDSFLIEYADALESVKDRRNGGTEIKF